jgi:hypothetical protein
MLFLNMDFPDVFAGSPVLFLRVASIQSISISNKQLIQNMTSIKKFSYFYNLHIL